MGILDKETTNHPDSARFHRKVLRANIQQLASRRGITYDEAMHEFARRIDRSASTIYSWLVEREDGSSGPRPMPAHHFDKMVSVGLLSLDVGVDFDEPGQARHVPA